VRLALRYGINTFDTSPWYGASEIVLGSILEALSSEFPRDAYRLSTKCGRYGPMPSDFDYSPTTIRRSIQRSLDRLKTSYLDTVYLHDVEYVSPLIRPTGTNGGAGDHTRVFTDAKYAAEWGLIPGEEGVIRGEGDVKVLEALKELRKLKEESVIGAVGISGYPLPTLLRLALLVLHTPPFIPLDTIMSYSHLTLCNTAFLAFLPAFVDQAKITQGNVLCASPLNMGFFSPIIPTWHPAPKAIQELSLKVAEETKEMWSQDNQDNFTLPNLALGFTLRSASALEEGDIIPIVAGLSNLKEVHELVRVWREVTSKRGEVSADKRQAAEQAATKRFREAGWMNWSWTSPPE
jgi:aryl-alcohol dehydrogenase-like predicted oxidoreductase